MTMRCPVCGTTYAPDAKFCRRDGARLAAVVEPTPAGAPRAAAPGRSTTTRTPPQGRPRPPRDAHDPTALAGHLLDGRYRLVRKVGEGGMSVVYLATDVASGGAVAIKILSASLAADRNAMARLRREAALGLRLAHPNICHIMRLGETDEGLVYVVMPFVEGELLVDRTNRLGQLPLAQAAAFVRDIAAGLHVAHQLKIVHRDLKPENVMICRSPDESERAVVMDFGLAKERRAGHELEKLTATGVVLGTPEFLSPEQLRGKPLDGRSDVYALGLVTYEMLTGKLPFTGRSQQEVMIARLKSEPMPIRKMRPDLNLPAGVDRVILRALALEPADRYPSAPEFAEALAKAAAGGGNAGRMLGKLWRR
jgi:serine/threonine protein kinase